MINKQMIYIHDLLTDSGKSIKEVNLEKQHKYKVDDLVEIIGWSDDCEYAGMRLYVIGCVRDCDGTPLYVLGTKGMPLYEENYGRTNSFYNFKAINGIGESSIKFISNDDN